jgi:hypothetical protein
MTSRISLSSCVVSIALASSAFAGTRYVDAALATGANDGSSWANAHQGAGGLQAALAASVAGDEVWVASGTYLPSTTGLRATAFQLINGVSIYGGFAGGEVSLAQRNWTLNVAILSGDLAGNDGSGIFTDNSYHVVNGAGTNSTAVLDGFRVRSGNANGAGTNQDRGGGILCVGGASPTIRRCTFQANRCTFGGGAGYINSSAPVFSDCTFDANVGGSFGGAFDMATSVTAQFDRCVFTGNSAARAGAIEIFGSSTVRVTNCLFRANTSTGTGGGGAIYVSGSAPLIRNCTILGNSATVAASGGILSSGATPSIANCIVMQNTGSGGSTGAAAQISPTTGLSVTYSIVPMGYAGTGNLTSVPTFETCSGHPYRLHPTSVGVDAGNNAGVPAGIVLDLALEPRFQEQAGVPNTGAGTAPIVDIGAYECSPDCNGNGVGDPCDVALGTSLDVNGNGVPDECECFGGVAPTTYCTAKLNSQFCLPAIGSSGFASASNLQPFSITAANVLNLKSGLLFYGYAAQAVPFQGGTLCVLSPIRRTPVQNSSGSASGTDCSGTFAFDFNAHIASGADPLIQNVGQQVRAQYWSRDPADPFTTSLTNALQFAVCQ